MEEQIRKYLHQRFTPWLIILFGSTVKGNTHGESDIDIAFLSDKISSEYEVFMAAQELADLLKKEVDLVDLARANTVFRAQVIGNGKVIWDDDPLRRMNFFMNSYKAYAKLNEERQPIFNRLKDKGVEG